MPGTPGTTTVAIYDRDHERLVDMKQYEREPLRDVVERILPEGEKE